MIKRPIRIVLAIFSIIVLYVLWMGVGSTLFGWRHGGGAIPIILFFALAAFVWHTITKKTPEEKGEVSHKNDNNSPKTDGSRRMNYYGILGVTRKASHDKISSGFRTLAKKFHPDLNKSPDAKATFILIYEAYSLLKDDQKRKIYDEIVFDNFEEDTEEKSNEATYTSWQETAKAEAKYYSETKYKEFSEKVLKNIKAVAKTTKVIVGFFGAMILCGLIGAFIIRPILNAQIENAIQSSSQTTEQINVDGNGRINSGTAPPDLSTEKKLYCPYHFPHL